MAGLLAGFWMYYGDDDGREIERLLVVVRVLANKRAAKRVALVHKEKRKQVFSPSSLARQAFDYCTYIDYICFIPTTTT